MAGTMVKGIARVKVVGYREPAGKPTPGDGPRCLKELPPADRTRTSGPGTG
jgi:hypothetical protein